MEKKRIVVVRVRGSCKTSRTIKDALRHLNLHKKHSCSIITNDASGLGVLKRAKDYATWGELNLETFTELLKKRGRLPGNNLITEQYVKEKTKVSIDEFAKEFMDFKKELKDIPGLKKFFRLCPPKKGYERKGTKEQFSLGGALGYRKEKINDLIKRML